MLPKGKRISKPSAKAVTLIDRARGRRRRDWGVRVRPRVLDKYGFLLHSAGW